MKNSRTFKNLGEKAVGMEESKSNERRRRERRERRAGRGPTRSTGPTSARASMGR